LKNLLTRNSWFFIVYLAKEAPSKKIELHHHLGKQVILRAQTSTGSCRTLASFNQAAFLSPRTTDCRGGTGLKTVSVSVCGNLQHIWQNLRFLKFFAFLHEPMLQNAAKISDTNLRVTSLYFSSNC
jgi:hypothetical protein